MVEVRDEDDAPSFNDQQCVTDQAVSLVTFACL